MSQHAEHTLTVKIEYFGVPEWVTDEKVIKEWKQQHYVAWIQEEEYKGIMVTGSSIDDCLKELSISIKVLELYRKNLNELSEKNKNG